MKARIEALALGVDGLDGSAAHWETLSFENRLGGSGRGKRLVVEYGLTEKERRI
jgi:hypothetical protein